MGSFPDTYNDPKRFAKFPNSIEKPIVALTLPCESTAEENGFNPLSPIIHIQILQTDLHTFP